MTMITDKAVADKLSHDINSGYWKVADTYFFDKSECLKYATEKGDMNVTFHFFDDFYKSINWKEEPKESLKELYKRRAEQLREKYDYIVVAFSGGADSQTTIRSFLDNGIHLDEIITSYPITAIEKFKDSFDPKDRSADNLMYEYIAAAKPYLDYVNQYHPKTVVTVIDHSEAAIQIIGSGQLHKLPVAGFGAAPSLAGHYLIGERLRKLSEKGKVCLLSGIDKPRMGYNRTYKVFGVWFDDVSTCWGHYNDFAFQGFSPTTEYFFYTLDMPEIWKKQCLTMKRIMEPIVEMDPAPDFYKRIHHKSPNGNDVFFVHDIFFKQILYQDWDINTFQAGKPSSFFFQESANWFYRSNLTTQREKDFHIGQVKELVSTIDDRFVVYDKDRLPLKFVDMNTAPIGIKV